MVDIPASPVHLLSARKKGLAPDMRLAAALYLPPDTVARPLPGLVVAHGAGSRSSRHQQFCLEACSQGFAVLALDFRGHGDSQGWGDGPLELDVLAAVRFLRDHPAIDGRLICYRGSSMGGFYGLKAAPEAGFTAMVLLCPASEDVFLDHFDKEDDDTERDTEASDDADGALPSSSAQVEQDTQAVPRWDSPALRAYFRRQDSRAMAARVECPVLLVHSRLDQQVPFTHSLLLAQHLRGDTTLLALASGTHTSAQHDQAIHAYTVAWLRDRVSEALARLG